MKDGDLRSLFDPYDGRNIRPHLGGYVVFVPYADHEPVVLPSIELATLVEAAISTAFHNGAYSASFD